MCCRAAAARIGWKFKKPFHMMSRFEVGRERGTHDEKLRQPRSEAFPVCDLAWWCRARSAYYSPSAQNTWKIPLNPRMAVVSLPPPSLERLMQKGKERHSRSAGERSHSQATEEEEKEANENEAKRTLQQQQKKKSGMKASTWAKRRRKEAAKKRAEEI